MPTKTNRSMGKIDQIAIGRDSKYDLDIVYFLSEGRMYRYLDPETVDVYCPDRFVWQPIARP